MMPPPRTHRFRLVLVGVDFSRQSAKALRYGVATARAGGGRVIAFHALDPLLSAAAARAYATRPLEDDTNVELEKFVRHTLGVDAASRVECVVEVGPARETLMSAARRLHADVVVVGTNGRGGVPKMFFGSATEALLRRYHGAVMVVPPHCADPNEGWPHGTMLAAVDPGAHRRAMLTAAARTAQVLGTWLTVTSPDAKEPRSRRHRVPVIALPLPDATRLHTFTQGTAAYEFVRHAAAPVFVVRTGRPIGHQQRPAPAA